MNRYILACDEGTSSARSVLFDQAGLAVGSAQQSVKSEFPQEGWVEQDAEAIWQAQLETIKAVLARKNVSVKSLHAIGITNQRETTIVWDRKSGDPIGPAITWQCRRTADQCAQINASPDAEWLSAQSGLKVDPYFSATKIRWLLDSQPDFTQRAAAGELAFGTVDSWLIYKLTGGRQHLIDRTNASRTLLMELQSATWSTEILSYFDIPISMLPTIVPSTDDIAVTDGDVVGAEIVIAGIAGDQQAAMIGQGCTTANTAKLTYGTGAFLLVHTGTEISRSEHGLLSTTAASLGAQDEFAIEGSVFAAGSAMQWLRDELGLIESTAETAAIANSIPDSAGVYLVPAFEGLGAPHWAAAARGALIGLSRGADKRHVVRAGLESIALQSYDLINALETGNSIHVPELRADGGAAANDFLCQMQADLLDRPVVRPVDLESTARGIANLAAYATDFWSEPYLEEERRFEPKMSYAERQSKLDGWHEAVGRVL